MKTRSCTQVCWLSLILSVSAFIACSSNNPSGPSNGSGGNNGTGSSPAASGGSTGSGGMGPAASGGASGSGGDSSPAGGASGSGGDVNGSGGAPLEGTGGESGALTLKEPVMRSASSYVLEFGNYLFEVDPTHGARIVTFSLGGTNLLSPVEVVPGTDYFLNGGATFWVAPQDPDWGWPPPVELDSDPYTPSLGDSGFSAIGSTFVINSNTLSVKKTFTANLQAEAIDIVYEVKNTGPGTAKHSPWEISRVARGGTTFWPKGDETCGGDEMTPTEEAGVYFWADASQGSSLINNKFSCDGGGGWIAQLSGELLLVKQWQDVPSGTASQHSVDKEIQVYVGDGYEEVEMRGPYQDITAGSSLTWNVRWYVRPAPADKSNAALVAAVEELLK